MKIDLIIAYVQRYEFGHERDFVPPITGIHLAAITPAEHEVRVFHQQVDKIDFQTQAEVIAISFFSGFAVAAYNLAVEFKKRGKIVVAGGPHVTYCQEEALTYFDAIVTGEAENVWPALLQDLEAGQLQQVYAGSPCDMTNLPTPRYDLLPNKFFIKKVIQATRGCPFSCSFCTVPSLNPGFRLRPIQDVLRDASYDHFPHWWQRKVVWFWDDNLTIRRPYIKQLLQEMIPLKKWWLTQASMDIAKDPELLDLMKASGCIGVFLGIESFGVDSLADANKKQNKIANYKQAVQAIRKRGIAVMAGFIAGFDHDDEQSIVHMAPQLMEIGIDVPFLSIMTPFRGTPIYSQLKLEGRMLPDRNWNFYNGYNVAFQPKKISEAQLLLAHRTLWKKSFSPLYSFRRILRGLFTLRPGAFLLSFFMNAFYTYKRIRKNYPIDMAKRSDVNLVAPVPFFREGQHSAKPSPAVASPVALP
ncbi:radical SAM protein [Rufibacter glacialis]|uniref:Radical SAM protein n=1 Tax=Rufibacter glacialis TaxID=1259555 RepID=A0A5M8QH95_9BACT|nr:radical SAM protein [Rufibacter glacialis]KAA6434521.1 B12-binding domain-containing radical SAM protein [Rufibacter glacialis]GGK70319.1 B12-binding domain-containing radical SAM protein [Rufibacter glacialis]